MAFNPRNAAPEGFQVINAGIHSGIASNILTRQQLSWAVNTTCRTGFPETRPGWRQLALSFKNDMGETDAGLQSDFEDELWQGAGVLETRSLLLCSIGGDLFTLSTDNYSVRDVS